MKFNLIQIVQQAHLFHQVLWIPMLCHLKQTTPSTITSTLKHLIA